MGSLVLGLRVVLAVIFAVAGAAKLLDQEGSRRSLSQFGVPRKAVPIAAVLLPLAELATAVALIFPASARWGALGALLLLLGFIGGIANAASRGQAPDCHCFGQLHSAPAGNRALARNAVLAGLAALVLAKGPGPSISTWVSARTPAELVAVAAVTAALVLGAVVVRLWLERRSMRGALADAETKIASLPIGLPVGATAPDFLLPDVHGTTHTLESLRARGRPVALIFFSPTCGSCRLMYHDLGRWQAALADRLTIAVISRGTAAENRPAAEEHGIGNLLLQEDMEVMDAYRVGAAPAALTVNPEGAIGSSTVETIQVIESLIRLTVRREATAAVPSPASAEPPLT